MFRRSFLVLSMLALGVSAYGMGRKSGDGYEIEPVKRGSAANPNPAFSAPDWGDDSRRSVNDAPKPRKSQAAKPTKPHAAPDEPEAPSDQFPDYQTPEAVNAPAKQTPPPLSKDSLEPPLPDEPGGDPDKRPSK